MKVLDPYIKLPIRITDSTKYENICKILHSKGYKWYCNNKSLLDKEQINYHIERIKQGSIMSIWESNKNKERVDWCLANYNI